MKRILIKILDVLSAVIIAVSVLLMLTSLLRRSDQIPNLFGYSALRVLTGSMEPTYPVDSLLIVKVTDPSEVQVGDVISFYSTDPQLEGAVNTHRVIEVREEGNTIWFITKGDAAAEIDPHETPGSHLIGKVVGCSMFFGKAARLLANPAVFIPLLIVSAGLLLGTSLRDTVRSAKAIKKAEDDAALMEAVEKVRAEKNEQEKPDSISPEGPGGSNG